MSTGSQSLSNQLARRSQYARRENISQQACMQLTHLDTAAATRELIDNYLLSIYACGLVLMSFSLFSVGLAEITKITAGASDLAVRSYPRSSCTALRVQNPAALTGPALANMTHPPRQKPENP